MQNSIPNVFYEFVFSRRRYLRSRHVTLLLMLVGFAQASAGLMAHGSFTRKLLNNKAPGEVLIGTLQDKIEIQGKVTSIDGDLLPGVAILVKGTSNNGTMTDNDGRFKIRAEGDAVLVVSYLGFAKQEVSVSNRTQIDINLEPDISTLAEIVVVGYGTIEKSDFTGASSTARLDDAKDNKVISVPEALQGRVAGVQIMNNTGQPGSGMTFNIRGMTSITGSSQPLIVIDGQPIESGLGATKAGTAMDGGTDIPPADPLASLNPDDIESIEILKDASSTAIYGSRGANGVVLITTKSGKEGTDKVTYSNRFDLSYLPRKLPVLSSLGYMNYRNEAALNDGLDSVYVARQLDSISRATNVDWQDEVYQRAMSQQHQISFSGKDDRNSYFITANYSNNNSILKNADFTRYGLRVNLTRNITDKLSVGVRSYLSLADRNYGQESNWTGILGSSVVLGALSFNPLQQPYDIDGTPDDTYVNNPALITTLVKDRTQMRTIIANVDVEYKFTRNLSYTLRGGVNDLYSLREIYFPTGTFIGDSAPGGSASRADNSNGNFLVEHLLTYKKVFAAKHRFNAVAAYSYQKWQNKSSSNTSMNFPSNAMSYYNLQSATAPGRMYTGTSTRALASVLGRVNYSYDNRYTLMLTGRYDGASRLAEGNKWLLFPSVGLGWNVSSEKFFQNNLKFVSLFKLRGSYGVSGNENIVIGATKAKYSINYSVVGSDIVPGYVTEDFANPDLTWEKTQQYNIGADFGLMEDRVTLSVDFYKKSTTDLLINLALPGSASYSNYYTNLGEVTNRGMDVEATVNAYDRGETKVTIGANFSTVRNKVVDIGSAEILYGQTYFAGGGVLLSQPVHVAKPGLPISTFWGYKTDGIYQNQEQIDADPALANDNTKSLVRPGDVKWVDKNGDGQINDSDKTDIGNPIPDFSYGFNANFSYKRFTLGVSLFGSHGNELINLTRWVVGINNTTANYNLLQSAWDGRWHGEGTSNELPRATTNGTRLNQRMPDWLVEDASFLRLQNVNLGYIFHLPKGIMVRSVRTFVSATNLYTWTRYSGYDPNVNAFGNLPLNGGVDLGTLPQARTFSAGIEVSF